MTATACVAAAGVLVVTSEKGLDPRELTSGESAQLAALPGPRRREVWLRARRSLRRGLSAAGLPADTSAHRFPSRTASLSHSAGVSVAAVLAGDPGGVVGVGVDVEVDRTPDPRTAPFFLTADERAWLDSVPDTARAGEQLRLWTVKEALFKADPGNACTVLRGYAVADPGAYCGRATRVRTDGPDFRYVSFALPQGVLSVAVALSQSWRVDPVQTVDFEQMAERISALISVPVARLTPDVTIAELVPDSFMFVEVAVDLQEEFDVVLSQRDLTGVHTLGDLAALLRARTAEA